MTQTDLWSERRLAMRYVTADDMMVHCLPALSALTWCLTTVLVSSHEPTSSCTTLKAGVECVTAENWRGFWQNKGSWYGVSYKTGLYDWWIDHLLVWITISSRPQRTNHVLSFLTGLLQHTGGSSTSRNIHYRDDSWLDYGIIKISDTALLPIITKLHKLSLITSEAWINLSTGPHNDVPVF